jgi:two-component system, response regulator
VAILLVEDDAGDAERALHALREASPASEVHWVRNGAEALDFLFCSGAYAGRDPGDAPQLVLLDVKMPRIDGIEVVRRMKGSQLRTIPVVVMTSSSEERDVLKSFRLGVDAYIVKPVLTHALRAAVSHLGLIPGS